MPAPDPARAEAGRDKGQAALDKAVTRLLEDATVDVAVRGDTAKGTAGFEGDERPISFRRDDEGDWRIDELPLP